MHFSSIVHANIIIRTGDFAGEFQCLNVNALSYAAAASGIAQDLIILILPLPVIATLQMHLKKKILTLLMFSLGVFILITSCIRLKALVQFAKSLNPTWDYVDAVLWTSLEVNISVVIVCAPAIRIFLAQRLPSIFGSISHPTKKSVSSASHTMPRRNEYADLPDRSTSQGATASNSWEQSSIELDGKVEPSSTIMDTDEGNTTLIPAHPSLDDGGIDPPRRVSWSLLNRSKQGSPPVCRCYLSYHVTRTNITDRSKSATYMGCFAVGASHRSFSWVYLIG
jgi:hypothetical protein